MDLIVSEVFGPTVQGEGPFTGRRSMFVRLGLCNLDCAWCDTPYTWDWTGKNGPPQDRSLLWKMTPESVVSRLEKVDGDPLVVITGGEPLVQARSLGELCSQLLTRGRQVMVETNGTLAPHDDRMPSPVYWSVSPKLGSSGVGGNHARKAIDNFQYRPLSYFKFVVVGPDDLAAVDKLVGDTDLDPGSVWLMPEGRTAETVAARGEWLVERTLERGYNFSTRLHVLLWGDERGR